MIYDIKKTEDDSLVNRLKDCFDTMIVYKDLQKSSFLSTFKLPSFMRDFVLKKFHDDNGYIDVDSAAEFIRQYIPKSDSWKSIQNSIINDGETVKILAKITIHIDIASGIFSFSLPDFGLNHRDTIIPQDVWNTYGNELLKSEENWGIIELAYQYPKSGLHGGKIKLLGYANFCPYDVDLEEFKEARKQFSLDEWIDIILGAVDYNPAGYKNDAEKFFVLQRILPFAEKRVNLLELAPAGTGKSYLFGQVSRFGWLVSGKVSRAKLIYDMGQKTEGVVASHDFLALDEIREAEYMKDAEIQSALQAIMENGKYRAADGHEVNVNAGIIFLGNISSESMNEYSNMLTELPKPFQQPQFLDRIHGFIKGWELPRVNESMKASGWALNSEYFSSIMNQLREDPTYRAVVDDYIEVPNRSDTRDTEAVKRLCTAFLKLLFPHVANKKDISPREFSIYCLKPAMEMRAIIRIQMGLIDRELSGKNIPDFRVQNA